MLVDVSKHAPCMSYPFSFSLSARFSDQGFKFRCAFSFALPGRPTNFRITRLSFLFLENRKMKNRKKNELYKPCVVALNLSLKRAGANLNAQSHADFQATLLCRQQTPLYLCRLCQISDEKIFVWKLLSHIFQLHETCEINVI